jgi:hypothetical protein
MSEIDTHDLTQYRNYHVQGSLIKSRLLYIHVNHGAAAIKKIIAGLPDESREVLSQPIYIGEWYSIVLLVHLDQAIYQLLANGNEKVLEELGAFSAGVNLNGAYEPLLRQDIHAFLELTTVLHKSYQDFGEAQYLRLADTAALLQFLYPQPPPENYCKSGVGYFRRAIELCGGQQVTSRMTSCQRTGDNFCEFRLEWRLYA